MPETTAYAQAPPGSSLRDHDARVSPSVIESRSDSRSCRVVGLTSERGNDWGVYVERHAEATLFHTLAWRDAVRDAFDHEAAYLLALREERCVGVMPMFLVRSRLAGCMLVSVPYGVGGGIIADDDDATSALAAAAEGLSIERTCRVIDVRSARGHIDGWDRVDDYVRFERELPDRAENVLGWLPRKARAAARNGRNKFGLTVSFDDRHLAVVWRLYSIGMRRLGSIAYPLRFFQRLIHHTPKRHWVALVRQNGVPVAGLVTFLFRDRVMPYFFGSTAAARRCCAANFTYLSVMERAVAAGYRVFDFGRSRRDNAGSFDFKRFHGFEPIALQYQRFSPSGQAPPSLSPSARRFRLARRVWKHLPLTLTQYASSRLAKHLPG